MTEPARHYAIAHTFDHALKTGGNSGGGRDLIVQYEVKMEKALECGGAYLKLLLSSNEKQEKKNGDGDNDDDSSVSPSVMRHINSDTPYVIMFGPDLCGATNKVHFIFRHQNPVTGEWQEKHMTNAPRIVNDQLSHVYTLIVRGDSEQSFEILIDLVSVRNGSLLSDFSPPVNPPKMIDDVSDVKPEDWVDEAMIDDPTAVKPDDWDEEAPEEIVDELDVKPDGWIDDETLEFIPDPRAVKPQDWNDEEDGDWVAPTIRNPLCAQVGCGKWEPRMIKNPAYRGKWHAPKIPNPAYRGEWKPRQIPNPNYFEDLQPSKFAEMGAIALELWTMQGNILFDNFLITFDEEVAKSYAQATWAGKIEKQRAKLPKPEEPESSSPTLQFIEDLWEQMKVLYEENPLAIIGVTVFSLIVSSSAFYLCMRGGDAQTGEYMRRAEKELSEKQEEKTEESEEDDDESDEEDEDNDEKQAVQSTPEASVVRKRKSRKE